MPYQKNIRWTILTKIRLGDKNFVRQKYLSDESVFHIEQKEQDGRKFVGVTKLLVRLIFFNKVHHNLHGILFQCRHP